MFVPFAENPPATLSGVLFATFGSVRNAVFRISAVNAGSAETGTLGTMARRKHGSIVDPVVFRNKICSETFEFLRTMTH